MMFADALLEVLKNVTRAADGVSAVFFVYDDLGDGFSAVAALGTDAVDGVIAGSDNPLMMALESGTICCEPLGADLLSRLPVLQRVVGSDPALLVPLIEQSVLGVAVVRGTQSALQVLMRDAKRLASVASVAAETIRQTRPDAGHSCRYRQILDVNPGGVAVVEGRDSVISYANAAFRSMLGMDGMPLIGRTAGRALQERLGGELLLRLEEVRAGPSVYQEPRLEVSDQYGPRYYDLRLVAELGGKQGEDATFIILENRTDRVSMRHALEQSVRELADSQSMLSAVLDGTDNGIMLVGIDGNILYANQRLSRMFELNVLDLVGKSQAILVEHVNDGLKASDGFRSRQAYLHEHPEEKVSDQIELTRPTHRVLDRYSGPVYTRSGTLLGRIEVYTDVTDLHELQRNKDEFLAVVSHELKTPVTSIKGYAQLLGRRAVREQLQASTVSSLGVIERQANRMQQLIETLLDLSRWDLGKLKFEPGEINLSALIRHAADLAGMTIEVRQIELELPASPVWIRGDERRIEQVVTNLLLNAIRYSPGGEAVTVSLHEGDDVRLRVQDRGIGIPPEARPRIFERFYRGPGMTDLTGLGIGLYISKNIVEQHGGQINVESEVGAGSTFTVTLPKLRPAVGDNQLTE